jgi:hypothetical protein
MSPLKVYLPQSQIDEDDIMLDLEVQAKLRIGISLQEQELSNAMRDALIALAHHNGDNRTTWEELNEMLTGIGEEHGCDYGVPLPSRNASKNKFNQVVMAPGTPLRHTVSINQYRTEAEERLYSEGFKIRNSWEILGDRSISVIDTEEGPIAYCEYRAGARMRKLVDSMAVRHDSTNLTAEAEFHAMSSLEKRISTNQYRSYVLNGMFPERSKRSDIHYIFRKGYPTIAFSYHGFPEGRIICCLCLHPFGYYKGTWAGMMTPTDEVIAALLLMRADEHLFWRKSGQWAASDLRSGL